MNFAKRILAYKEIVTATLKDISKVIKPLNEEYFVSDTMVVVKIANQSTVDKVIDAIKGKFKLRIDNPKVIKEKSFALVGKGITVRRIGSVIQLYEKR